jgi:hypothetical protein
VAEQIRERAMRMRQWGLLTAGVVAVGLAADVAGAQDAQPKKKRGISGFLDKVNKVVCGPDGTACAADGSAAAGTASAGPGAAAPGRRADAGARSGARARVEAESVEGGLEFAAKFDTTGKLGTRRTRKGVRHGAHVRGGVGPALRRRASAGRHPAGRGDGPRSRT